MRMMFYAVVAASLTLSGGVQAASSTAAKGEAKLAKMLEGRIPGEPESCISAMVSSNLQVIDETAVVYDAGNTIYVARPKDPKSLDRNDILVINRFGSQLCKQDVIRTIDRTSGFMTGVVFLGDFVPYRKN